MLRSFHILSQSSRFVKSSFHRDTLFRRSGLIGCRLRLQDVYTHLCAAASGLGGEPVFKQLLRRGVLRGQYGWGTSAGLLRFSLEGSYNLNELTDADALDPATGDACFGDLRVTIRREK